MTQITTITSHHNHSKNHNNMPVIINRRQPQTEPDRQWLKYFSIEDAYQAVINHIEALPSSSTPERHTMRAYTSGLDHFLRWLNETQPDAIVIESYITHLKKTGRSAKTAKSKYLTPVRLFLNKLLRQHLNMETMDAIDFVCFNDIRQHIQDAIDVKPPRQPKSDFSNLYQFGTRLTQSEMEQLFASFDLSNLKDLRNYAIAIIAVHSAMRVAELQRLSLSCFKRGPGGVWTINIRGKGSVNRSIPIDQETIKIIKHYIKKFNDGLPGNDPRRIRKDDPVFQPITAKGNYYKYNIKQGRSRYRRNTDLDVNDKRYNQLPGLSAKNIGRSLSKATEKALNCHVSAHDFRRTAAAQMMEDGVPTSAIQRLLGHQSETTTKIYTGDHKDLSQSVFANNVQYNLPDLI